jgi:diguanylate cyclase (GGDEF)-like protein
MFNQNQSVFLLASADPALRAAVESVLIAFEGQVQVVLSLDAAMAAIAGPEPPTLVLLDVALPSSGISIRVAGSHTHAMSLDRLLAAARRADEHPDAPISIVLISDTVTQHSFDRLGEGVVDDLIPRDAAPAYWKLRIENVLRNRQRSRELESFREAAARDAQIDHLTGVFNRETILAKLFRETDRVQRMNSPLSLILLDIDDFGLWNSRFGSDACDDLLFQVAGRMTRALRSYDLLGRPGKDEFLLVLPGCPTANAAMLASRIRLEVFGSPFLISNESVRLSASFGITSSQGRSPIVVLREAEQALHEARIEGPEAIRCFGDVRTPETAYASFRNLSRDRLLAL